MSFMITVNGNNDWEEINLNKDREGFVNRIQVACELIIVLSLGLHRWDLVCYSIH